MKILKYDLCGSCRKIQWRMNDGNLSGMTLEEFISSPGYNTPMAYIPGNHALLLYLVENNGCESCVSLLKRATLPNKSNTTPPDILSAIRKKAESGDVEAMLNLSWKLGFDFGVTKNEALNVESNSWLEKAASLGNAEAQFELACVYMEEKNDNQKAVEWLEKSARNGFTNAKHNLAICYLKDIQDKEKSFYWMEQASNEGHVGAKRKLGLFHIQGIGVSIDTEKGISLLQEAANLGDEQAKRILGIS
jgi:TPR repeat protein